MLPLTTTLLLVCAICALGHQVPLDISGEPWTLKYGPQIDLSFTGPLAYSHLSQLRCLEDASRRFDIAVLGMPFDTAVSYRPGARFGPYAIRSGSRRQREARGYTLSWGINPYTQGYTILDCGDVPVTPYDNAVAIQQMEAAYSTLIGRPVANHSVATHLHSLARDENAHPRIITLGGDHTIVLPILRSLHRIYGPISVIHFDAHLDTWSGVGYPGSVGLQAQINHGTFFHVAATEGLLSNTSVHAGIRCKLGEHGDVEHDALTGFRLFSTDDIDVLGVKKIIDYIRERVSDSPVYVSLDIDVLDPSVAPATGTPEAGGWTAREVKRIIRGLSGLNIVGADIVEVAPAYDLAEITGIVAADIAHDFLSLMTLPRADNYERRRPREDL